MKKIIALALAIFMIAAMAVPAFAADQVYGDENLINKDPDDAIEDGAPIGDADDSNSQTTDLIYGVSQSYVVSIPADVILEEALDDSNAAKTQGYVYADYEIGLSDVIVAGNEKIEITAASENNWTLVDKEGATPASTAVNYYLTIDNFMTSIDSGATSGNRTAANEYMVDPDGAETAQRLAPVLTVAAQTGNVGTEGNEGTVHIYFSSLGTAQEGTFKDTITFTVAVVPAA